MDATPNVESLRPERGATPLPASRVEYQSAAAVRQEIYATLAELHSRVEELQGYVHSRFGSIDDPLHVRERIAAQPIRACGLALVAGVVCGVLRVHKLPWNFARRVLYISGGVVRGAGATLGSKLASDLVGQAIGSRWRASSE